MSDTVSVRWIKSSYSGPTGANCVEVASLGDGRVSVRDSWQPGGPVLTFTEQDWAWCVARWGHVKTAGFRHAETRRLLSPMACGAELSAILPAEADR